MSGGVGETLNLATSATAAQKRDICPLCENARKSPLHS